MSPKRECACRVPLLSANPRSNACLRCGYWIDPDADWQVSDRTHNAFLDRAEVSLAAAECWPKDEPPPPAWIHFRNLALQRERVGRKRFALGYLGRDNIEAGTQENSDGANYTYFDVLQAIRWGDDLEMDVVLTAFYHDYKAYENRLRLRGKRHGEP